MNDYQQNDKIEKGPSVLITGGSGLIGRYLTSALLAEGYQVSHLSRETNSFRRSKSFQVGSGKGYINPDVFEGIDYIVHLSGANIGEKRWSVSRKKEIISSRVDSANLLFRTVSENNLKLKAFISASAIGYYGSVTSEQIFTEDDLPGDDFLGTTCRLWEEAALQFEEKGIRTVRIRTAVVLEKNDSALRQLMAPAKAGLVIRTGTGKQYFPWIHIEDLCNIYLKAIMDDNLAGAYNAVAPEHIDHNSFVRTMAAVMHKPVFLPPVPSLFLRAAMGEMSDIVLKGSRISDEKIIRAGYRFRFEKLFEALGNIIRD